MRRTVPRERFEPSSSSPESGRLGHILCKKCGGCLHPCPHSDIISQGHRSALRVKVFARRSLQYQAYILYIYIYDCRSQGPSPPSSWYRPRACRYLPPPWYGPSAAFIVAVAAPWSCATHALQICFFVKDRHQAREAKLW